MYGGKEIDEKTGEGEEDRSKTQTDVG